MKKLVFLFLSLLTAGSLFQACDNSKTYAEMLEDEKNAVNKWGDNFSQMRFHKAVLDVGPASFDVIQKYVFK